MRLGVLSVLGIVFLAMPASGDIVTRFDFTGNVGTTPFEMPIEVDPNIVVNASSNLTRGSGLTTGTGQPAFSDSFVSRNWVGPQPTDYLAFTVTPQAGYFVSLDSVDMGVLANNADRTLVLRSSLDNFATNLGSVAFSLTAVNRTMSFATPLSFSEPVTFRLVTLGATNNNNRFALTSRSGTAGLVLNGSVAAVPEPSSLLLLTMTGLATVGTGAWRRRRSRTS